jgi:hypothetical protein
MLRQLSLVVTSRSTSSRLFVSLTKRRGLASAGNDGTEEPPKSPKPQVPPADVLDEDLLTELFAADEDLRRLEKQRQLESVQEEGQRRQEQVSPAATFFGPAFATDLAPAEVAALLTELEKRITQNVDPDTKTPVSRLHVSLLPLLHYGTRLTTHRMYVAGHELGEHPMEHKASLEVDTDALVQRGLISQSLRRAMEVIAGQRFQPPSCIRLTCGRFASRAENVRWLLYVFDSLVQHARYAVGEWDRQQLQRWRYPGGTADAPSSHEMDWLQSRWDASSERQLNGYLEGLPQILVNERQRWLRIDRDLGEPFPYPGSEP